MSDPIIDFPGLTAFSVELSNDLWAAYRAQPDGYTPRTHHFERDGRPRYVNHLIHSASPYLLQHAHNPVAWRPWGDEAFAAARKSGRPILLSVGYSTCHWCHVMERESFEDEEIAGVINELFVPIKVDREERPDVDAVYMTAVQLMSGRGGWPMTVFLTPEGKPFFAGTYFPPRDGDRGARWGFLTLLRRLAEAWRADRNQLEVEAGRLTAAVRSAQKPALPERLPGDEALVEATRFLGRIFDPQWGGFGQAPKFPRPSIYELLLRYHRRSGDPAALHIVAFSLEKMIRGGMYDHLGGGFARYSTDREWLVPHFEKMLYDNAQLAVLLTEAWQATGRELFEKTLRETLDYVLREMTHPQGGFYSATDADSEGEEGKFFVWTPAEVQAVLGSEAGRRFATVYGISESGNFEGRSVLHLPRPLDAVAQELGLEISTLQDTLKTQRRALYRARGERVPPLLDDKILTEWNAQMIGALARAGAALNEPSYLDAARRAGEFMRTTLQDTQGSLARAWREGRISGRTVLEDYAFAAEAYLDLFEATAELPWLRETQKTIKEMNDRFWDASEGGYFATPKDRETLLVRDKPGYDGAQPSGNSVAARVLLRLAALTGNATYQVYADQTMLAFGQLLENGAVQNPKMATALDWRVDGAKQILIVVGPRDDGALTAVLRRRFVPNAVRIVAPETSLRGLQEELPWLEGKGLREGRSTAYVCLEGLCKAPTTDPEVFEHQLDPEVRIKAPPMQLKR